MVLDEPTNDLDMDTLELLQEVLDEYEGTILIVSHDRDFMDKVATSLLYMKGDGTIYEHVGTYTALLEKLKNMPQKPQKKIQVKNEVKQEKQNNINKLSYKDKRLLEVLPDEINVLDLKIKDIEKILSEDVDLYTRDSKKFDELTLALDEAKRQKDEKETLWLEIEMKAEELG